MKRRTLGVAVAVVLLVGLGAFGLFRLLSVHSSPTALLTPKPSTCADTYRALSCRLRRSRPPTAFA